jgi:hypothetical protein
MNAERIEPPAKRVSALVQQLEGLASELDGAAALDLRTAIARISEELLGRAIAGALSANSAATRGTEDLRIEAAARHLDVSKSWLHHHWRDFRLGYLSGRRLRFRVVDLDRYVAARRREAR